MTAFVALLFAFPLLIGLWRRYRLLRKPESETFLTVLSIGNVNQSLTPQYSDRYQMYRVQNQIHVQEFVIPPLYYFAAWTDSGCLLGCRHHHQTVASAANCISEAGGYVVAVEKRQLRALTDVEEELFRLAYYGAKTVEREFPLFEPMRPLKPSLN